MPPESFTFRSSWLDAISAFDPDTQAVLFRAIACRELHRRLPRMTRSQRIIFQSPALQPHNTPDSPTSKPRRVFVPPTIEEVTAYIRLNGLDVDPVRWWHFYNSKGWLVGDHTMRSWKSSIQTWAHNPQNKPPYATSQQPHDNAAAASLSGQRAAAETIHDLFG